VETLIYFPRIKINFCAPGISNQLGAYSWITQLVVKDHAVTVPIDDEIIFDKFDQLGTGSSGSIEFWIDAATDAYFSNLVVKHDE
jgi:hypothetical protein